MSMSRVVFLIALVLGLGLTQARPATTEATIAGYWLTQGRDGVIAIAPCGSDVCGHIAGVFLDHPTDPMPVDHRGVSQCDLPLITSAQLLRPNFWKGHITDPRNGNVYGAEMHLNPRGELVLRGYFGIPLFGETQTWTRYTGWLPANCRINR
jgi:uncharacterized protein (DUF2147 family)